MSPYSRTARSSSLVNRAPTGARQRPHVTRLNPNGTPDQGFGTGGRRQINSQGSRRGHLAPTRRAPCHAAGRQDPRGRQHVGRRSRLRHRSRGSPPAAPLDPSFSPGGTDGSGIGGIDLDLGRNDMALDASGRILLGGSWDTGTTFTPPTGADAFVLRLKADGSDDTTFSGGGLYSSSTSTSAARTPRRGSRCSPTARSCWPARGPGDQDGRGGGAGTPEHGIDTGFARRASATIWLRRRRLRARTWPSSRAGRSTWPVTGARRTTCSSRGSRRPAPWTIAERQEHRRRRLRRHGHRERDRAPGEREDRARRARTTRLRPRSFPAGRAARHDLRPRRQAHGELPRRRRRGVRDGAPARRQDRARRPRRHSARRCVRLQGDPRGQAAARAAGGGRAAARAPVPRCAGHRATIVGTNHRDKLKGTPRADVIVGARRQ